jgi:hypothetical protein
MVDFVFGFPRPEDRRPILARQCGASVGAGAILKYIAEVGSVRQGDPKAYVVSVFQYGLSI